MPGYAVLYKYTEKGLANIKASPERIKQNKERVEQAGSRVVGVWALMGPYDLLAVVDASDEQAAVAAVLTQAGEGNVTTLTMRAFSEDEFAQIISRLP